MQKNPFSMAAVRPEKATDSTPVKPGKDPEEEKRLKEERERRERIESLLATLKVHTVLTGAVPVARIGDENVRVGDTLVITGNHASLDKVVERLQPQASIP